MKSKVKFNFNLVRNPRALSMLGQSGAILGFELNELVKLSKNDYFVITADYGIPAGASRFKTLLPNNYINCGIAEQNMIGVAAGIASNGATSIAVAQACFISMRSFEQIRQYCGYMNLPIIMIGVSSGFALQFFGNTHYALEDVSLMNLIPNVRVYTPSDALSAIHCFHLALKSNNPSYIRCTGGIRTQIIYHNLNEISGSFKKHGSGNELAIISSGSISSNAIKAKNLLDYEENISVFDIFDFKGLDQGFFDEISLFSKVLIIEEHSSENGIGDYIKKKLKGVKITVQQPNIPVFGHQVGTREFQLNRFGLDTDGLANIIKLFI